jgi:transcriptional regulator with XRE-family HTH domain
MATGPELRGRREALGLSREEAGQALGLAPQAVEALESGDAAQSGPHAAAWLEAYAGWLDRRAPPPDDAAPEAAEDGAGWEDEGEDEALPEEVVTWPWMRAIAITLAVAAIVLMAATVRASWRAGGHLEPVGVEGAVRLRVVLQRTAPLTVWVDGAMVSSGTYNGKSEDTYSGRTRIDLDVADIADVRLWMNDRELQPQGELGVPRRLTFVAGRGGAP